MSTTFSKYFDVTKPVRFLSALAPSEANVVTNAPLSNVLSGFTQLRDYFDSRVLDYDGIASSLILVDGLLDFSANNSLALSNMIAHPAGYFTGEHVEDRLVTISEEDHTMILSAFIQRSERIINAEDESYTLTVTAASGRSYQFVTHVTQSGENGYIENVTGNSSTVFLSEVSEGEASISVLVYSFDFVDQQVRSVASVDEYDALTDDQLLALYARATGQFEHKTVRLPSSKKGPTAVRESMIRKLKSVAPQAKTRSVSSGVASSTLSVVTDLAVSSSLNDAYADICQTALSDKPGERFQLLFEKYRNDTSIVGKKVSRTINTVRSCYVSNGLRGVFQYFVNLFRGLSSLSDSNGILNFTDNSAFLPTEFIAGAVSAIISSILSIVGQVLSLIRSVVVAIVAVLAQLASALISAFSVTYNDTRATQSIASDINDASIINASPFALLQSEVNNSSTYDELTETYNRYMSPLIFPVIGGSLIVGPGAFNDDGAITKWRYEFHPYPLFIKANQDVVFNDLIPWPSDWAKNIGGQVRYNLYMFSRDQGRDSIASIIYRVLLENYQMPQDESFAPDGSLTSDQDAALRAGIILCTGLFQLWCLGAYAGPNQYGIYLQSNAWVGQYCPFAYAAIYSISQLMTNPSNISNLATSNWANLSSAFIDSNIVAEGAYTNRSWNLEIYDGSDESTDYIEIDPLHYDTPLVHAIDPILPDVDEEFVDQLTQGAYYPAPASMKWAINTPKYNASTYWKWVALTAVITAVIIAVTVVVSVTAKKAITRKRADNKARYMSLQSTYEQAVNGEETYIDEDGITHTRQFDPASPEGQAKVNAAYKAYKKCAFTNNLWANVIGGSRYDINTFYGEAEVADDVPSVSESKGIISYVDSLGYDSDLEAPVLDENTNIIYSLIAGVAPVE